MKNYLIQLADKNMTILLKSQGWTMIAIAVKKIRTATSLRAKLVMMGTEEHSLEVRFFPCFFWALQSVLAYCWELYLLY